MGGSRNWLCSTADQEPLGEASNLHSVEVSKKVANCPGTLFPIVLGLLPASVVLPIQRLREGSRPKPPVTLLGRHEFCSDMMQARAPCCDPRRIDKN